MTFASRIVVFFGCVCMFFSAVISFAGHSVPADSSGCESENTLRDELIERVRGAFFADRFQAQYRQIAKRDGSGVESIASVRWRLAAMPTVIRSDGSETSFEILRLSVDWDQCRLVDSDGKSWRSVAGGLTEAALPEGASEMSVAANFRPESADRSQSAEPPRFVSGQGEIEALLAIEPTEFFFPDVFAPTLSEHSTHQMRLRKGETAVTILDAVRSKTEAKLTVQVRFDRPFDFFDSHQHRLARCSAALIDAKGSLGRVLRPKIFRPLSADAEGASFELIFDLSGQNENARNFSIVLPRFLAVERAAFQIIVPHEP